MGRCLVLPCTSVTSCSSSSCSWTIIAANLKTLQACRASHPLPWTLCAKLPKKRLTICVQMWTRTRQRRNHSKLAQLRGALVNLFFMLRMLLSFDLFLLRCNDEFDVSHILSCWQCPRTERKFYFLIKCCGGG